MKGRRPDALRIADMLGAVDRLAEIERGGYSVFEESWIRQAATIRQLEILGEAAGAMSSRVREEHPEIGWREMRGFSSFSKHEYWQIAPIRVWAAVQEMAELRLKLLRVFARSDG
jgi:uncharacterized protein with HEPN domain